MNLLAISGNETAFWLATLVVVAVLVVGVIALTTTLIRLIRSINLSMQQLQEVAEMQAAQVGEGTSVHGAAAQSAATAEPAGRPAEGQRHADEDEVNDREGGGAKEG